MRMLREHSISSVCKHYGNVTFEYSLNIPKQVVTFKKRCYIVTFVHKFEKIVLERSEVLKTFRLMGFI